jgi:hypothetical protein
MALERYGSLFRRGGEFLDRLEGEARGGIAIQGEGDRLERDLASSGHWAPRQFAWV